MKRRELLRRIAALPADADVGVQIGDDHLDISEVVAWGDGAFGALRCHRADLRDLFLAWQLDFSMRSPIVQSKMAGRATNIDDE
jgi:hypothetical protein